MGVQILQAVQSIQSPLLDSLFYFMTQLHHELVYILLIPVLYWIYDKRFARYLLSVFLIGLWINILLKDLFHTARPSPEQVRVLHPETGGGYAFPSGHAMNPLMFWGALALQVRAVWFTILAVVLLLTIGISRLYLGLHWPLDVLGGWAIGLLLLLGFERTRSLWSGESSRFAGQLILAVLVPVAILLVTAGFYAAPLSEDAWMIGGAYMGFWVGAVLEERYLDVDPRHGAAWVQAAKLILGFALMAAVQQGLGLFLPDRGVGTFSRYLFVGLTGALGAPWLFGRLFGGQRRGRTRSRPA